MIHPQLFTRALPDWRWAGRADSVFGAYLCKGPIAHLWEPSGNIEQNVRFVRIQES
jgi:hypothetical protein